MGLIDKAKQKAAKFADEWAAAGQRLDELEAKKPKQPTRQLTDEEKTSIAANTATTANALNTIQINGD